MNNHSSDVILSTKRMLEQVWLRLRRDVGRDNVQWVAILCIVLLGSYLRLRNLGGKSLWLDEIGQVVVAKSGFWGIISGVTYHFSPPLDYIITYLMLSFGESEFTLRLPAAIFGILAIFALYMLGKEVIDVKGGLLASFLLAISPFHFWYSQEVRMYSLLTLLSIVATFYFYKALTNNSRKYWMLSTITLILCIYTHYWGIFILLSEGLVVILMYIAALLSDVNKQHNIEFEQIKSATVSAIKSFIITGLSFMPWVPIFYAQTNGFAQNYGLSINNYFPQIFETMCIFRSATEPITQLDVKSVICTVYGLFFLIGTIMIIKDKNFKQLSVIFAFTFPLVFAYCLTAYRGPMATARNFIYILPFFLIIISKGIIGSIDSIEHLLSKIDGNIKQIVLIGIIISLLASIFYLNILVIDKLTYQGKQDWRGAADYLYNETSTDDLILLVRDPPEILAFYYKGPAKIATYPKNDKKFKDAFEQGIEYPCLTPLTTTEAYQGGGEYCWHLSRLSSDIDSRIAHNFNVHEYRTVWILSPHSGFGDKINSWLQEHCIKEKYKTPIYRYNPTDTMSN